jgi:hypothetical protein
MNRQARYWFQTWKEIRDGKKTCCLTVVGDVRARHHVGEWLRRRIGLACALVFSASVLHSGSLAAYIFYQSVSWSRGPVYIGRWGRAARRRGLFENRCQQLHVHAQEISTATQFDFFSSPWHAGLLWSLACRSACGGNLRSACTLAWAVVSYAAFS